MDMYILFRNILKYRLLSHVSGAVSPVWGGGVKNERERDKKVPRIICYNIIKLNIL